MTVSSDYIFFALILKLFPTTETELKAIAAAAIIGFNKKPQQGYNIPAAKGMPIKLYIKAQKRFSRIAAAVCRD